MRCVVEDCPEPVRCLGYCDMHHARVLKYGGPGPAAMIGKWAPLLNRFLDNVQLLGPLVVPELGPCHQWMGTVTKGGYGRICDGGKQYYAHRYAWKLAHGRWPAGRLGHRCRNRRCVRLEHLRERGG